MSIFSKSLFWFLAGMVTTGILLSQFAFQNHTSDQPQTQEPTKRESNIHTLPPMPNELSFAQEATPLERWDVSERFEREYLYNYYYRPNILHLQRLAHRYFPIIEPILAAHGIPDDFKYLCVAESNLYVAAKSPVGAISFWQFMNNTAPQYNLIVNTEIDQRYDLEKATAAASKYILEAYKKFGSWTAAAAAYNCGHAGYQRQVQAQKTTHYYELHLPEETNRYIYRIIAFKYILENAATLGFELKPEQHYKEIPHRMYVVNSTIPNLSDFARKEGTDYKRLKLLNPWIKGQTLTYKHGLNLQLKIPTE
jgi:membrane-bound lytic murein transglycosylase D